jgi:uncharacterized coiled-coil protein SlyX
MTDENTVFDAAFEYRMNGMSEESARVAASEDETKDARIAELENALAAASGTIAAMRDNVAAGQARNAQLQDTLQDIASTGVGWTVQAARDALKSKPW